MKIDVVGKGEINVLIVHGWMHSGNRYTELAQRIDNATVSILTLPGFGGVNYEYSDYENILAKYRKLLVKILNSNKYDVLIGHSMGCNIILKALARPHNPVKVILLNPVYNGLNVMKPLTPIAMLSTLSLPALRVKNTLTDLIIKRMSLLTVGSLDDVDPLLLEDVRRAVPLTAMHTLFELIWDSWRIKEGMGILNDEVIIIRGENDKIVSDNKIELLVDDLQGHCRQYVIFNAGHTPVLECYETLLKLLLEVI